MSTKQLSLDSLVQINKLQIGPPKITRNKISAEYQVELKDGKINSNTLTYSYDEDVFDLQKPESINLASMMAVQVALNYGLFCEEIIFDGLFDDSDRRFILDMLENTSREIYVNKLLSANPFLTKEYQGLQAEKRKRYTQAKVTFINSDYRDINFEWQYRETDISSYVILSSGGKDSLLSYGVFKELKKNVHPVFINESGRHWFTALNAFRYLKEKEKNTARVWCNSDRIFNWMLRQLPFIRQDFNTVKADIYPLRLWTVAVFLFGVLPIAHLVKFVEEVKSSRLEDLYQRKY